MRIHKTIRINIDPLTLICIVGIFFVVGYIFQQQSIAKHQRVMEYHCNAINSDPTRPYLRMCVKAITLNDGNFVFKTKGGVEEHYLIIAEKGDVGDILNDKFNYNFVK